MVFTYPPPQEFGLKLKEYRCAGCDYKTTVRHDVTKHMDQCDEMQN